jgi:hypothetical protein
MSFVVALIFLPETKNRDIGAYGLSHHGSFLTKPQGSQLGPGVSPPSHLQVSI